ncbi:glucans biosynthesis glucosyltransferase MdoH [Rubrivivax gelatinosus]|nr:glucans biosynthesis glucosyltransferase MdoH [Rubrivivax gelatinosus]
MKTNLRTAPRVMRSAMRPHPWFGFLRGLIFAVMPGMRFGSPPRAVAWLQAAKARRRVLLALVAAFAAAAFALTPEGTPWAQTLLQTLLFAWVAIGFATALMGGWVMLRGDPHALRLKQPHAPIDRSARTAVIMPICNEDIATVYGGLRATCESLAATGALSLFDIYVLSDTADPKLREAEVTAWERLRTMLGDGEVDGGARVFYRWRRRRTKRKAGNVADFCRRWGSQYRYMVVLDADSTMSGRTLVDMVRLMEENPRAGIVQSLPTARAQDTLHSQLQQFATRVTGRLFSLGMAFWQLGESHYWGHNAIIRVEAFMTHCALAPIPGRGGLAGDILSHDFVEAALMRRAGYEVWLAPQLDGSWEQYPPNLLAELQRDRRWCQGNLQNARLVAEPGWRPAHRAMFVTGALSYAIAPLWLVFVVLGALFDPPQLTQDGAMVLWIMTAVLLLMPRVLGVAAVFLARDQQRFGGSLALLASAVLELLASAVQAPLRMLAHTSFVIGALTGLKLDWKSPPRQATAVAWRDAAFSIGLLTLPALALAVLGQRSGDIAFWHLAPLLLPLVLAVPFTVLTGSEAIGRAVRRAGLLLTPEDRDPPRPVARAADNRSFADLMPLPPPLVNATRGAAAAFARPRAVMALGAAVLAVLVVLPQPGVTPQLSPAMQAEREIFALMRSMPLSVPNVTLEPRSVRVRLDANYRPAARIDDDIRRRALESVQRAQGQENYERLVNSLAKAAAIAP